MSSMGSSVDWTWPRQESLNRKTCPYKLPKLKCKQKKEWKKKNCGTITQGVIYAQREYQEKKEKKRNFCSSNGW